jgi:oxygen-dependent protoporphyrinogen oxidase
MQGGNMTNKRIVVVGAGIAGLTAAYFLKQEGHDPIVLEKTDRVGGRMITDVVNGFTIDCGAQFLMTSYPILTDLINRLGMSSNFIETSPYLGTVRNGKIRKTRATDVLSPLRSGLLSLSGWLRFVLRSYQLMPKIKSLPLNDFTAWSNYDDIDAETWSNSYFGREITDYIIEPPIDAMFYQSLRDISRVLPIMETSMFLYLKKKTKALIGGIGVLPEGLASQLDVRLNTPVRALSIGKTGVELDVGAEPIIADKVILAATASVSKSLYKEPETIERDLLATPYSTTLVIAVAVKDSFRIDPKIAEIYGIMIPKKERGIISAITIEESKYKRRFANGKLLLVFLSGKAGSEMIKWNEDAILPVVLKEMEKCFAGVSGNILFTKLYRWNEASPMSLPGRSRNVDQYRKSVSDSTKVFLAGDYMGMPWTEGAAETGRWAARSLMRNLA